MADILLETQSGPSTPSSGQAIAFVDSTALIIAVKDANGRYAASSQNASITTPASTFATDTYIVDSDLLIPSWGLQVRTVFNWDLDFSKTAAGTAAPIYVIRIGTARTTADTARLTLTGPAATAIADIGTLNIRVVVRVVGASAVLQGTAWWNHRGTAASTTTSGTGFANDTTGHIVGTSAAFDSTAITLGSYIGLSINGGTSAVWTLTQVYAQAKW